MNMWLKFKFGIIILIIFSTMLFLNSCLEEPTIAPTKRPYSVTRVINLSNSSSQIFIDSNQPDGSLNSVTVPSTTAYFDINSGKRRFIIKNSDQDTIFNANIEIISYEREIVVFAGTYSDVSENNTLSSMKISEGEIYFNAMPDPGKVHIILANAFPGYYSESVEIKPVNFAVFAAYCPDPADSSASFDTTYISYTADPLKFGFSFAIGNADPGSYKFSFMNEADSSFVV